MAVPVRRFWWIGALVVGAAVVAVAVAVTLRPTGGRQLPPARARQYRAFSACLLTGAGGLADVRAATVWSGMQDASSATLAKVSYLAAVGPETVPNALPFAESLIQQRCDVVVAVGTAETAAIVQEASKHLDVRFVVVGANDPAANVVVVADDSAAQVRPAVARIIKDLIGG